MQYFSDSVTFQQPLSEKGPHDSRRWFCGLVFYRWSSHSNNHNRGPYSLFGGSFQLLEEIWTEFETFSLPKYKKASRDAIETVGKAGVSPTQESASTWISCQTPKTLDELESLSDLGNCCGVLIVVCTVEAKLWTSLTRFIEKLEWIAEAQYVFELSKKTSIWSSFIPSWQWRKCFNQNAKASTLQRLQFSKEKRHWKRF